MSSNQQQQPQAPTNTTNSTTTITNPATQPNQQTSGTTSSSSQYNYNNISASLGGGFAGWTGASTINSGNGTNMGNNIQPNQPNQPQYSYNNISPNIQKGINNFTNLNNQPGNYGGSPPINFTAGTGVQVVTGPTFQIPASGNTLGLVHSAPQPPQSSSHGVQPEVVTYTNTGSHIYVNSAPVSNAQSTQQWLAFKK